MRSWRGRAGLVFAVVILGLAVGCGSDDDGAATTSGDKETPVKVKVEADGPGVKTADEVGGGVLYTYDMPVPENPSKPMTLYYLQVHEDDPGALSVRDTIRADAESLPNVKYKYFAAGGYDKPDVQLNQLELAVNDPTTKAIILWSVDPKLNAPLIKKALDKGIAVVGFLEPLDDPRVTNTIYDDTTGVAEELTDAVIAHMGGKGKIATILGIAGSTTHRNFVAGTKASIENHPDVELAEVREYEGVDPAQSQQLTEEVLRQHPDLKGIVTIVGQEAQGVSRAIDSSGLKGQVKLGSWAITGPADVEMISSGSQTLALGLPFVYWAHAAVRDAVAAADGKEVDKWEAPPGNLMTTDNILKADLTADLLPKYLGKYSKPTE
jgi:ribose transport system substrate-binding protein